MSFSIYLNKIKSLMDMFGAAVLLDTETMQRAVQGLDLSDEKVLDRFAKGLSKSLLKMDPKVLSNPTALKMVKLLEKEIMHIYAMYKSGSVLEDVHHEAVKHYLMADVERVKTIFRQKNADLHEDVRVFLDNGRYCIFKKDGRKLKKVYVTNFALYPISTVMLRNKDIEASLYNFRAVSAINGMSKDIVLLPSDLDTVQSFQKAIHRQAEVIKPQIHDLSSHMRGMAYELTERCWTGKNFKEQIGTTVLGYERFSDDGNKYMCTVDGTVYDKDGNVVEDVVFIDPAIRIPEGSVKISNKYGNMKYDKKEWPEIAKFVLPRFMKLNKKDVMANIMGWFFANVQEYNIRKVLQEYPILHVAGPRSSGKSRTIGAIKPYFGHRDSNLAHFPTPPIFVQDMTLSYTIPAIFDEYGGSDKHQGWSDYIFNEMHKVMKHVYDKTTVEKGGKGDGGQGRFVYKIRNSLCSLGQIYIRDQSIATRAVQVNIDGSIKGTSEGDIAYKISEELMDYPNKNFITGYMLWAMNLDDAWVIDLIRKFRDNNKKLVRMHGLSYDERQQHNDVAIQTGLYLMLKLSKELGVDPGFDEQYVWETVLRNADQNSRLFEQTTDDPLIRFLRDVAVHLKMYGNRSGARIYGPGGCVVVGKGKEGEPGMYGRSGNRKEACIYGKAFLGIKMKEMISIVNTDLKKRGKDAHDFADIQPYLESAFNKAKARNGNGLVLAPENYYYQKTEKGERYTGWYTLFDLEKVSEISEDFLKNPYWNMSSTHLKVLDENVR